MAWTQLPTGQDVPIQAPYFYAVLASVKSSHSIADIKQLATNRGLNVFAYEDPAPVPAANPDGSSYRYVLVQAQATQNAAAIPWSVPVPLDLFDGSHMVAAWSSPPEASGQVPPLPVLASSPASSSSASSSSSSSWLWWVAAAAAAYLLLRPKKKTSRCLPCEAAARGES